MTRTARCGFTLIELLVVISIIALLVGILMPSFGRARQIAYGAQCRANLHGTGISMRMYLNDSRDVMPVATAMPSLKLNDDPRIADVLAPYLDNPMILCCPADEDMAFYNGEGSSYQYHSQLGGRKVSDSFLTQRLGESNTPVLYDYEPFHGSPGESGAANYLFADLHVGDLQ